MFKRIRPALVALATIPALYASVGLAHHSTGMFDRTKTLHLEGTVKEFQWTNPHSWIQLNVTTPAGVVEEWSIEGNSPNQLIRLGWKPTILKPGDPVTIIVYPMRDGAKGGMFVGLKMADGKVLGEFAP